MKTLVTQPPHFTGTMELATGSQTSYPTNNIGEFAVITHWQQFKTSGSSNKLRPTSRNFRSFLSRLEQATDDSVTSAVGRATRVFLLALHLAMRQTISDPQALMSNDGYLSLAWEREGNQFSVEVYPDWKMDWFWRNKFTKEILMDEGIPILPLPETFARKFEEAFGQHGVIGLHGTTTRFGPRL